MGKNKQNKMVLKKMVGGSTRGTMYLITIVVTVFLNIYNGVVCPFLESLPFFEGLRNLLAINVAMLVLREILYLLFPKTKKGESEARHAYKINVFSWIIGGLLGVALHEYLYTDAFPWHSALKILSGYWIMGGGLVAQLEYVLLERKLRSLSTEQRQISSFLEHIARRLIESTFIFVFMPVAAMLIMVIRYVFQDHIIPISVALEISYLGVVFLLLALVVNFVYGAHLRKDTKEIATALRHVKKGNFNINLDETRSDELGAMAWGINEMTKGLRQREKIREAFGRFVNPEIAQEFIEKYANKTEDVRSFGELKKVAVLMCDIRGFTALSAKLSPNVITSLLNKYFSQMVAVVQNEGGLVDKFIGDAIMAVFGIIGQKNSCVQAVRAGIGMRTAVHVLNTQFEKEGLHAIDNGIGIHYGDVIAGYIGSEERLEYTVIGSTVNIASRLCDVARKPKPALVFTKEVVDHTKDVFKIGALGTANLKGVGDTPLFSVKK